MAELFELNAEFKRMARARIKADPWHYAGLWFKRLPLLWWHHDIQMFYDLDPPSTYALVCLAVSLLALLLVRESGRGLVFLWVIPIYVTVMHIPVHCEPRFTLPAMPALAVLCGCGIGAACRMSSRCGAAAGAADHSCGQTVEA